MSLKFTAPIATFPKEITAGYPPQMWGALISDTYLDRSVGAADDSVIQAEGAPGVMSTRSWRPVGDADKVYMIGFEYTNGSNFKARALRQELVNYVPAGSDGRRSMDMDGKRPNNDIDLEWPVAPVVP